MSRIKFILLAVFTVFLAWGNSSFAVGLGFTHSRADETWQDNSLLALDPDHEVSSLGFLLDTSVARDRVFSYRLSVSLEENRTSNGRDVYKGLATTHDFTFAILQNLHTKLWLGPRVKFVIYEEVTVGETSISGNVQGFLYGPVIGLNVHLSHVLTLVFTKSWLDGDYDSSSSGCNSTFFCNVDFDSNTTAYGVSLLFRIGGDRY